MTEHPSNLSVYRAPEVVAHYAGLNYVTACEQLLFATYLRAGIRILDLGVGGGRTTAILSQLASYYVGVDYAQEMVDVCRQKFPNQQFEVTDASDLSSFADISFDAVVFSFNGLDYLVPDEKRRFCLRECHRVLKRGGVLIFSSHNPRALLVDTGWSCGHLRDIAGRIAGGNALTFYLVLGALTCTRVGLSAARTLRAVAPRAVRRLPTTAFWRGEGYFLDPSHGGLLTHCAVPDCVIAEVTQFSFTLLRVLPEDYPRRSRAWSTRWYYFAFSKL